MMHRSMRKRLGLCGAIVSVAICLEGRGSEDAFVMLEPSDVTAGECLGGSVAIDGDIIAAAGKGIVRVFVRGDAGWAEEKVWREIEGWSFEDRHAEVSVDGDRCAVGVIGVHKRDEPGRAFILRRHAGSWTVEASLLAEGERGVQYGRAIALHGDVCVVGDPGHLAAHDSEGKAFVFERRDGRWTETATLVVDDPGPMGRFGNAVATNGAVCLVGGVPLVPETDFVGVFTKVEGGWNGVARLEPVCERSQPNHVHQPLAIDGRLIAVGGHVVGTRGAVSIHDLSDGVDEASGVCVIPDRLPAGDAGAIALGEHLLAVAGFLSVPRGGVVLFEHAGGGWKERARFLPPGIDPMRGASLCVDLDPSGCVVGAPWGGGFEQSGGAVYFWPRPFVDVKAPPEVEDRWSDAVVKAMTLEEARAALGDIARARVAARQRGDLVRERSLKAAFHRIVEHVKSLPR